MSVPSHCPVAARLERRAWADGLAHRRHDVPDSIVLELLGRRAPLVDVSPSPQRLVHLTARHVHRHDRAIVEPALGARAREYRERLAAVVSSALPRSMSHVNAIASSAREKEASISLIWAKCNTGGACPFSSGPNP
jgi:hypothetical protein